MAAKHVNTPPSPPEPWPITTPRSTKTMSNTKSASSGDKDPRFTPLSLGNLSFTASDSEYSPDPELVEQVRGILSEQGGHLVHQETGTLFFMPSVFFLDDPAVLVAVAQTADREFRAFISYGGEPLAEDSLSESQIISPGRQRLFNTAGNLMISADDEADVDYVFFDSTQMEAHRVTHLVLAVYPDGKADLL
jgi:hypothetical protein